MKKAQAADFPAFEAEMLRIWKDEDTFKASLANREGAERFSFYDGPPFANGLPHFGHTLVTSIKDALGRYKTMRGYYVERRNGWDTHGLPVEFAIEKELGVSGKKQILDLGLQKFNDACRASVFKYKGDWEDFFARAGRWTDTEHAYATIDRDYTESVWWMLGQVDKKKLLYRGYKSMPYCPRCETPLSNFELNEGYKDNVTDPSVYAKFELVNEPGTAFLAWTTTPWTLPVNSALSVDPEAEYVTVQLQDDGDSWKKGDKLILAKARLDVLDLRKAEYKVVATVKGSELNGLKYKPLFDFYTDFTESEAQAVHTMYLDEAVSLDDGSGILHSAPLYGETDLLLGQRVGLPMLRSVGADGKMVEAMGPYAGKFFKNADKLIVADLTEQGKLFAAETFEHTYPFCYRCETPLFYNAISTWFVKVSAIKDELQATASQINWQPNHIKEGRFGKWLDGARDWAISRNRYWGAPLPIWMNVADENDYILISSLEELAELAGLKDKPEDLHRPGIDQIVIERDGKTYKRIEEVFDCWFESGSMPVAQYHYPFENKDVFEASFPADYIGEGLDQTRLWFYVQHVLSTIAFDRPAYKNVLVNGMVMAADGQKLSKRLKNYPPVEDVFASEGADTLRFYLLGNDAAVGADYMRFNREAMRDIQRNVFGTIWNTYSFLSMYAEIDKWQAPAELRLPHSKNVLDQWMITRLNETILEMTEASDAYQLAKALRPLRLLVDDMSNWYVRRSRRRFWKSEDDGDKQQAYVTLHYVLCRIAQLLAPWSPFVADKLWRELTEGTKEPKSVHLSNWPEQQAVDNIVLDQMALTREAITQGLAVRGEHKIKVRQPLATAMISAPFELSKELLEVAADELNVKLVTVMKSQNLKVDLDIQITPELKAEGQMRDIIRHVQQARKNTGFEVEDRIHLVLDTESADLKSAIETHAETIMNETLAVDLGLEGVREGVPVRVDGEELFVELRKVAKP
jgi:isoleucyl-tRNA synthetase